MVQTDTAFLRIEAALGTSQHRVSFAVCSVVFSHVNSPSSAQNNRSAVLHLDEANSGVFNVVGLVVPGIELTAVVDLTLMLSIERVAELLEGSAANIVNIVVVHEEQREVKSMRTDVDQRTAALLCLIREYAPCRNATAAEVCSLCIVNIAKNAGIDNLLSNLVLREVAILIADRQHLAGSVSCFKHLLSVSRGSSHRLLAQNVLASLKSSNGDLAVCNVRGQNVNSVDRRVCQKFMIIGVNLSVRGAVLFSGLFCSLKNEVAECAHIYAFLLGHAREVLAVCDTAAADKANSYICHWNSPPKFTPKSIRTPNDLFLLVF